MPPRKAVTAGKLRVQKEREERAKQEPAVEPEVELEEPEEEPAAGEFSPGKEKLITWLGPSAGETLRETLRKNRADHAQEQDEWEAVEKAKGVAYAKEMEEIDAKCAEDIRMMELDWPAWEQQQAAACANGCVCVCRYGGSRKRDFSVMGPPLASRSVSTFNTKV